MPKRKSRTGDEDSVVRMTRSKGTTEGVALRTRSRGSAPTSLTTTSTSEKDGDTRGQDTEAEHAEFKQVSLPEMEQYRVDLNGADMFYQPDFITPEESAKWYTQLLDLETYHPTLKLYGREVSQSRGIAAYSTTPREMKYSGASIDVHSPFPPPLRAMCDRVEAALGVSFNMLLLNRYDDGGIYIGRHSDPRHNGVIASVSLGAQRTFVMTPRAPPKVAGIVLSDKRRKELAERTTHKWKLGDGSLLVMQGETQDYWKHEIPREPSVTHGRISLTFRQLSDDA